MEKRVRKSRRLESPAELENAAVAAVTAADAIKALMNSIYGNRVPVPIRIIKSNKVTIVFWDDDTKTIVRCAEDEVPDDYDAFTAALAKKVYGSNTRLKKMIKAVTVEQKKKGDK